MSCNYGVEANPWRYNSFPFVSATAPLTQKRLNNIFRQLPILSDINEERGHITKHFTTSTRSLYKSSRLANQLLRMNRPKYAKMMLCDATMQSEQELGSRVIEVQLLPTYIGYNSANKCGLKVTSELSRLIYGSKSHYFDGVIRKGSNGWN